MRSQLFLLIAIMALSINAHPFFRKLADTKDSCTKAGKDYEEIPAQCKAGDKIYNVTKEEECKSGTWEALDTPKCSVSTITEKKDCTGTPIYTAEVKASDASCKLGEVNLPSLATDSTTCEAQLKWNGGSCSATEIKQEGECTGTPTFTQGKNSCKLGDVNLPSLATDSTTCVALTWTNGSCSATEIKQEGECTGTPTFTQGKNSCKLGDVNLPSLATDSTTCVALTWTNGSCSATEIKQEGECTGTPTFTQGKNSCKLGDVNLPSLATDSTTCVALTWTNGSCSATEIKQEGECTGTPTFTQGKNSCKLGDVNLPSLATDSTTCVALTWTNGSCSATEIKQDTLCSGKPTFTPAVEASEAKCTLGKTEITDTKRLASKSACETPLVWLTGTCEGNTEVTIEDICKSKDPEFTDASVKCVDKASSNSNSFLSFKFALFLVVCLLF